MKRGDAVAVPRICHGRIALSKRHAAITPASFNPASDIGEAVKPDDVSVIHEMPWHRAHSHSVVENLSLFAREKPLA